MSLHIVSPHSGVPGEARAVVGPWETQHSSLLSFYLLSGQVRLININISLLLWPGPSEERPAASDSGGHNHTTHYTCSLTESI